MNDQKPVEQPTIRFPDIAERLPGHACVFSYSGFILKNPSNDLLPICFDFCGARCGLSAPFRVGHETWRPIPLINVQNVKKLFGDTLAGLPLQAVAIPAGLDHDGTSKMDLKGGRGDRFVSGMPPDSLVFVATGEAAESICDEAEKVFLPRLINWLRVLTKQWWIGQSTETQTGNMHFEFEISKNATLGPMFAARAQQTTAPPDMQWLSQEVWLEAVNKTVSLCEPEWRDLMACDISKHYHNQDHRNAILLICCYAEIYRDEILVSTKTPFSQLRSSSTDLLKHLSVGFENAFGRNLEAEQPETFHFLKACWIARGNFSHGKPLKWSLGSIASFADLSNEDFYRHLGKLQGWLASTMTEGANLPTAPSNASEING